MKWVGYSKRYKNIFWFSRCSWSYFVNSFGWTCNVWLITCDSLQNYKKKQWTRYHTPIVMWHCEMVFNNRIMQIAQSPTPFYNSGLVLATLFVIVQLQSSMPTQLNNINITQLYQWLSILLSALEIQIASIYVNMTYLRVNLSAWLPLYNVCTIIITIFWLSHIIKAIHVV